MTFTGPWDSDTDQPGLGVILGSSGTAYYSAGVVIGIISNPSGMTFTQYGSGGSIRVTTPSGTYTGMFIDGSSGFDDGSVTGSPSSSFQGSFDALSNSSGVEYIGLGTLDGSSGAQFGQGSFHFSGTTPTPEPNSFVLVLSGVAIMFGIFWRKVSS
jgi:hypothetical protein